MIKGPLTLTVGLPYGRLRLKAGTASGVVLICASV
jgi:hypothetical protein